MRRTRSGKQGSRGVWPAYVCGDAGQSLILVVIAMTVIVAIAAFAIDVAQWEVGRHKAQVTADATALAAASCLADLKCANNTAAENKADTVATDNGYPNLTDANYAFTSSTVKVTVHGRASSAFAGMFGFALEAISGTAVASYKADVTAPSSVYGADCSNPTNPPASSCTVDCTVPGVTISTNGKTDISGAIETNGYVDINIGGTATLGPVQSGLGVGTTCGKNASNVSGNASIAHGPADATGFTSFPTTYSGVWTSPASNQCTASSRYTDSSYSGGIISVSGGTSTVPSTITIGGNNTTVGSATPVIMCASTSITISGEKATLNNITLVAPSILIQGNKLSITAATSAVPDGGGAPAVALYDTGSATLDFGTNDVTIAGAVYAPLAEISIQGNNGGSALFEGNTVLIDGNNGGDGPTTTLTAFDGGDQLIQ